MPILIGIYAHRQEVLAFIFLGHIMQQANRIDEFDAINDLVVMMMEGKGY